MIEFLDLSARNFGSWGHVYLDLCNQGTVCITGETGSGKSTLFRCLSWCLFGNTPDAIYADEVRPPGKATAARLRFQVNGHVYSIMRYRKHPRYGHKVRFIGHGIPDVVEDSHVKTVQALIHQVLGVTETVFRTTTYFAQRNFHHFHTLTDQGKKAYIESLTYGSLFDRCERVTRDRVRQHEHVIARLEGRLQGLAMSIERLSQLSASRREEVQRRIAGIASSIETCEEVIGIKEQERDQYLNAIDEKLVLGAELAAVQRDRYAAEYDVTCYRQLAPLCPRCGLEMPEILREGRLAEAQRRLASTTAKEAIIAERHENTLVRCKKLWDCEDVIERERTAIKCYKREMDLLRTSMATDSDTDGLIRQQKQLKAELHTQQRQLAYLTFWQKGFSLYGLRSIVLHKAIAYFTERVRVYLHHVMGTRIDFSFLLENNRLLTECNGRSYGALSGGERQSVDLCTGLALRDLAELYNKCRFNLLIADEPAEGMDSHLTTMAQDLLLSYGKPSTFLITHQGIAAPFSVVYEVSKNGTSSYLRKV